MCPNELLYEISGKIPLSYQIWKRRLAFFIQGINSSADSIIMKGMVELYDMEKQYDITTWLADTMRMVAYIDPSAQLKSRRTATGDWVLRIKGEGLASEFFHCSHLETEGLYWWIPEHAADGRYDIIHKQACSKNIKQMFC